MLNGNYGLILLYLSLFFLISTDMYLRTNVPFQYTISGDREQVFLLYYKDFFEQICSDVQFISPPEELGEFLLHLLKLQHQNERFHLKAASNIKPDAATFYSLILASYFHLCKNRRNSSSIPT